MTDGPFKNLKLGRRLKKFAEAVQNVSVDQEMCCAYAADATLNSILSEAGYLIGKLISYGNNGQMDFDPQASISSIFDSNQKSQFGNNLQREVLFRLHERQLPQTAVLDGLLAAIKTRVGEQRTRIQEECLKAFNYGEMRRTLFERCIKGSNKALEAMDLKRILVAVSQGDNAAFKKDVRKKKGLDEGPEL